MRLTLLIACTGVILTTGQWLSGEESADGSIDHTESPAYHAEWGPGRGFNPGQTLPDIPLIDLDGEEVRFDRFLGKRYILYGWASW
ncbi:MAG: hypothetical protein AAF357_00385 [Verrucomicrobiota bacterium]